MGNHSFVIIINPFAQNVKSIILQDLAGATNKIGIFNRSFAELSTAISSGYSNSNGRIISGTINGTKSGFNSLLNFVTKKDLANIAEYNRLVGTEGVSSQTAWNRTMLASSQAAQRLFDDESNLIKTNNGLILSENAIATATNKMSISAKAGQVAMKGLAIAGNCGFNHEY